MSNLETLDAERDALAVELERAVDAAVHVGALKCSDWYRDRKALLTALDERTARG